MSLLEHQDGHPQRKPSTILRNMYQKNLHRVPADTSTQALLQALYEGRLFIQPAPVPASDTRAEVLTIIARISDYATDPALTEATWHALLADDTRFRPKHHSSAWQNGSGASPVNRYRIAAIVHFMYEIGLYDMQICKSANLPCGFSLLCRLLFPGENYDLYRRGCTNYACYEDECLIRNLMTKGGRYE